MANRRAAASGQLRIIGGRWRGRKFRFKAAEGLRPTPDRVRETLFNWLAADTPEARCLDLYAGSGALGLEALSRGAAFCRFVDVSKSGLSAIRQHLRELDCQRADYINADALDSLKPGNPEAPFDIVFLDPPFGQSLLAPTLDALQSGNWLAPGAAIYVESSAHEHDLEDLPGWTAHRDKRAGDVRYRLFVRDRQFV